MTLEHVLSPIDINGVTLRNRVVRTAHGTNIGHGRVDDDLIAYHLARGRGGVGLSIVEAASVHRTDTGTLRLHDEGCIADFRRLMDAIRPTGMKMFSQLGHLGHDGVPMDADQQPWSASEVRSPGTGALARAMTVDEIEELTACFARVAGWVREGGVDGVEVHAPHGYLLQEFLSPVTNHRTDRYGGSFENRLRFTVEVVAAVRAAVGRDFVVGIRTGADATDEGVQAEDCADVVAALEATGLIDYVNVTFGSCRAPHKIIGAMHEPSGYELPTSEVVTKVASVPTLVTGRFRTLAEADEVIRTGLADLVGMTRAHIADPDIVRKTHGRSSRRGPAVHRLQPGLCGWARPRPDGLRGQRRRRLRAGARGRLRPGGQPADGARRRWWPGRHGGRTRRGPARAPGGAVRGHRRAGREHAPRPPVPAPGAHGRHRGVAGGRDRAPRRRGPPVDAGRRGRGRSPGARRCDRRHRRPHRARSRASGRASTLRRSRARRPASAPPWSSTASAPTRRSACPSCWSAGASTSPS